MTNERILAALEVMGRDPTLKAYLDKTLDMRAEHGHPLGSFYPDKTPAQLLEDLQKAAWKPFTHPAIMEGCTAFQAPLPGKLGIVDLTQLPPDTPVTLEDPKGTGNVSAVVSKKNLRSEAPTAAHTVLILGPNDTPAKEEIIFTFHPGDPVRPSMVKGADLQTKTVDAQTAIKLGLSLAKLDA